MKADDLQAVINLPDYALKLLTQKDAEIERLTTENTYHSTQLDRAREEIGRLHGALERIACGDVDFPHREADKALAGDSHDN